MAELFIGGNVDPATHERTGDEVRIDTDKFTTHGVIVGMTGSGKTGLGVVLLEEVLNAGLPTLIIDPKGDLTNLCLTFPNLAPADFEPWVDDAQAKANGGPAEFAKAQSELWTNGLAGWGLSGTNIGELRAKTDFTIYTPGSETGVPINIVGSLQAPADMSDAEIVGDEIEGYVTGLLGLVGIEADPLASKEHILLSNLIANEWQNGRSVDLPRLVGMIGQPPIRKLGVFDLDQFYPEKERTALAMKLNGLLASPAFATWAMGQPMDIQSMLYDGDKGRCAIVTTAHLSEDERQFVTSLLLAKLVTWMRRQSGTTDLRAMLYMDEVAGYLPPTAMPPTKKPIMTLMKQARAFGVGVVLSTQNPVDIDYKALSNAGTWMIGRLSTEQDKARLLDGLTSAAGDVDVDQVSATISALGKREFVLKVPGKGNTDVFTTRWAMSYLRGPMTRDQISTIMVDRKAAVAAAAPAPAANTAAGAVADAAAPAAGAAPAATTTPVGDDETTVQPSVADGTMVRWVDVASPWLATAGGDPSSKVLAPVVMARVQLRYDEEKADLVQDVEYECVLTGLGDHVDVSTAIAVDYDDRDLRDAAPEGAIYKMTDAKIGNKTFFSGIESDLVDHLYRSMSVEIPANADLKLYGRPGETTEEFAARCKQAADDAADAEAASLKDKYQAKVEKLQDQIEAAEDRVDVLEKEKSSRRNRDLLDAAGSLLGGFLGGRSKTSALRKASRAAGVGSGAGAERVQAAENKVERLNEDLAQVEAEFESEIGEIDNKWADVAAKVETIKVGLEKNDIKVSQLVLAWMPTA